MNNRGMAPIVKYFFIVLICVGGYFGYLKGMELYQKSLIAQAESDIRMIIEKIHKFKTVQGGEFNDLHQLKANFLPSIDYLKDPWGNGYLLDAEEQLVYSMGPDGMHSDEEDETWDDDISLSYDEDEGEVEEGE
jgi:hypothetical protein